MKKILSVLAMVAVVSSALAQGTINFQSAAGAVQGTLNPNGTGLTPVAQNGGFVSLLWAPAATAVTPWTKESNMNLGQWLTANPGWAQVKVGTDPFSKAINLAGRFTSTTVTVPSADPIKAIVIGWTGASTTFDQAYALASALPPTAGVGFSAPFTVDPEAIGSTTPSPNIVTAGFSALTLTPTIVPEPTSLALAGLGAAALLIFRRRN